MVARIPPAVERTVELTGNDKRESNNESQTFLPDEQRHSKLNVHASCPAFSRHFARIFQSLEPFMDPNIDEQKQ